jgi:hypothetical protein
METENHNEEAFRKLLKKVSTESPNTDFTPQVVKKIALEMSHAAANEEFALTTLLQATKPEQPSASFTDDLMLKLQPAATTITYKPVISTKAWCWIAASVIIAMICCFLIPGNQPAQTSRFIGALDNAARATYLISDQANKLPELYSLAVIGLASLLAFDYLLRLKTTRLAKS